MGSNPLDLTGKVAVVTGGAAGIGAECARVLAEAGATVVLSDVNAEVGERTAEQLRTGGHRVVFMQHDVTSAQDWATVTQTTVAEQGGFDILVNNAATYVGGTLVSNSLDQVQTVYNVNVNSVFLGMKYAAEVMRPGGAAGKGGSIINLSSAAGLVGVPGHSAYGSTKGAVRLYSKHAAVEFAILGYRVRVNSVHPGVIETAMGDQVFQDFVDIGLAPTAEDARNAIVQQTPLGRLGTPRDVANMVLFLASDAADYVTGAEFAVDGGLSAI